MEKKKKNYPSVGISSGMDQTRASLKPEGAPTIPPYHVLVGNSTSAASWGGMQGYHDLMATCLYLVNDTNLIWPINLHNSLATSHF